MPSDFDDPEAALAKLLKDNPALATQIAASLKGAEDDLLQFTDEMLSSINFDDPAKSKQSFADLLRHVRQNVSSATRTAS